MRVVILANDVLKEELLSPAVAGEIEIQYLTAPALLQNSGPIDACIDLLFDNSAERIDWLKRLHPAMVIVSSVITPLQPSFPDFVRINGWPTFLKRPIIEATADSPDLRKKAETLLLNFGKKTEWVPDLPGFISPRVISSIINEAFYTLEEKVSTEEEIDTAMKLGTNYPYGPFEWAERIGLQNIYLLLTALADEQPRYQPSSLLKQKALA